MITAAHKTEGVNRTKAVWSYPFVSTGNDPDGEEIDDYFSRSGRYLGSDNSTTDNVRIISESTWNGLSKTIDGKINHQVGYVLSSDFATETRNGMSTEEKTFDWTH